MFNTMLPFVIVMTAKLKPGHLLVHCLTLPRLLHGLLTLPCAGFPERLVNNFKDATYSCRCSICTQISALL